MIDKRIFAVALTLIAISGCRFPGPVDPDVDPKKGSELLLIVLDDLNVRTPETASILRNSQYWEAVKAKGHAFRNLDASNEAAAPFKANLPKEGMPALIVYRLKDMQKLASMKLPTDTAEIDKIILKFGGNRKRGPPKFHSMTGELIPEPDVYIDGQGNVRRLGMIPADAKAKARRMKMMGFGEFLQKKGMGLIPRDKWVDVEYPKYRQPQWILDQHNSSGCVGYSEAGAHTQARDRRGMKFELLSGSFTYAHINGGQDGGAMILDAMLAGKKYGHALRSEFDYPQLFLRQIPASVKETALKRQTIAAYPVNTFDEVATALQLGFVVQAGVQVDGNFGSFDANGVSRARGRYANHSIYLDGMKQIDGKWVCHMPNSWGASWGPFRDGTCYLRPEGIVIEGDAFVHADSEWLPEDLPAPRQKLKPLAVMNPLIDQTNTKGKPHAMDESRFVLAQ